MKRYVMQNSKENSSEFHSLNMKAHTHTHTRDSPVKEKKITFEWRITRQSKIKGEEFMSSREQKKKSLSILWLFNHANTRTATATLNFFEYNARYGCMKCLNERTKVLLWFYLRRSSMDTLFSDI